MKNLFSILFLVALFVGVGAYFQIEPTFLNFVLVSVGAVGLSFLMPKGVLMETISAAAARDPFTDAVVAKYSENVSVPGFFRSFFPSKFSNTKQITFAIKRAGEQVAVDILRGTSPDLSKKRRSSISTFVPPYYAGAVMVNELDGYDTAWASLNPELLGDLAMRSAEELEEERKTIERALELQCAEILLKGYVTLANGDNIDFKRSSASMPTISSGAYWTVNTVDPMAILSTAGKFLREKGKAQGGTYNVIMGGKALNAMLNNPIFQAKYDVKDITLGEIREPQRVSTGASLHGRVTSGSYIFNVWTYSEVYEDVNGNMVNYLPETDIIVLPTEANFEYVFAAVPMLPSGIAPGLVPMRRLGGGEFWFKEYVDPRNDNHVQEIRTAGCPLPVAIDQIFSTKVVA
jgi:hypothetical protein